jgi:tetratricopeptide (TPR) repeat protein
MKKDTAHYYIDWISMTFLGDKLYDLKRYEDAKLLYENNSLEFPDKDLAQFGLGKVYEKLGRKEDAINVYKKVIKLNPKYQEAINRLKELEK